MSASASASAWRAVGASSSGSLLDPRPVRGGDRPGDIAAQTTRLEVAGRVLLHDGGVWIEEGVDPARVDRVLEADSAAARELIAQHPELAEVAAPDRPAIIALDGEIVELR
ncbi:MAG: hypothetical protein GY856_40425 [bacterium]|nr:hypothetical protein [bacterium]